MVFKTKRQEKKNGKKVSLICLTDGYTYEFAFSEDTGLTMQLEHMLKEVDDEGNPLWIAPERISGLPIRVLDSALKGKIAEDKEKRKAHLERTEHMPSIVAIKWEEQKKADEKSKNKKAARAVRQRNE